MARGTVKLEQDICKACELCVSVCPKGCLTIDQEIVNAKGFHPVSLGKPDECIGCANCAVICPDAVITVYRD